MSKFSLPYGTYTARMCADAKDVLNTAQTIFEAAGGSLYQVLCSPQAKRRLTALAKLWPKMRDKQTPSECTALIAAYNVPQFERLFSQLLAN